MVERLALRTSDITRLQSLSTLSVTRTTRLFSSEKTRGDRKRNGAMRERRVDIIHQWMRCYEFVKWSARKNKSIFFLFFFFFLFLFSRCSHKLKSIDKRVQALSYKLFSNYNPAVEEVTGKPFTWVTNECVIESWGKITQLNYWK